MHTTVMVLQLSIAAGKSSKDFLASPELRPHPCSQKFRGRRINVPPAADPHCAETLRPPNSESKQQTLRRLYQRHHQRQRLTMVRYAATSIESANSARARGSYLRVSFKNTRETAQAINGWKVARALQYLENVTEKKEAIPMRRYAGSTGRCAQG